MITFILGFLTCVAYLNVVNYIHYRKLNREFDVENL